VWAEGDFTLPLVVQAFAQTLSLTALVLFLGKSITLPDALTFGALFQTCRLFGGEVGSVGLAVFVRKAEQIHSNLLGLHVPASSPLAAHRIAEYAGLLFSKSQGIGVPERRAIGLLSAAVRTQANTLAYADGFIVIAAVALVGATFALILDRPTSPEPAKAQPLTGTGTATPAL
jgi:DHA2 family multidrug resistance protein